MARINNRSLARIGLSLGAAAVVALGTALPSFATSDPVLTVGAGTQSTVGITFGAFGVTLNGSEQTPTTSFTFADIYDSRGSGAGWNLSLTLARFADANTPVDRLPLSSLLVKNTPIITAIDPTSSAAGSIASLLAPGFALDTGVGIKILSAPANQGMGSYTISRVNLGMVLPATTMAGVYTSTATVSLNAVP